MQPADKTRLFEFIEATKAKGASDEFLASFLIRRGWPEDDVYTELGTYWEHMTGVTVPERTSRGESSRDAFLYLLAFSTLATWTSAFGSLLFRLIDRWFPDPVAIQHTWNPRSAATWQMASIAVAFPIFLAVMFGILREAQERPERLESSVRKWLTYIALLFTAGSVICDLIVFFDYLLTGELTIRFLLKSVTVLLICGAIFSYYLGSLRWDRNANIAELRARSLKFGVGAAIAVVVAFCLGLGFAGTPSVQRHAQADRKRIEDLRSIAYAVNHWYERAHLSKSPDVMPHTVSQLVGRGITASQSRDPETNTPYSYSAKSGALYEVCAAFSGPEPEDEIRTTQFWHHGQGRTCFTLDASTPPLW